MRLTPVNYNPFDSNIAEPKLTPVDYDPFAAESAAPNLNVDLVNPARQSTSVADFSTPAAPIIDEAFPQPKAEQFPRLTPSAEGFQQQVKDFTNPNWREADFETFLDDRGIEAGDKPGFRVAPERTRFRKFFDDNVGDPTAVDEDSQTQAIVLAQANRQGITTDKFKENIAGPEGGLVRTGKDISSGAISVGNGLLGYASRLTGDEAGGLRTAEMHGELLAQELLPDDPTFFDKLASGVGSMGVMFVPGAGIIRAAQLSRIPSTMATWLGSGASAGIEAAAEAGSVYTQLIRSGVSEEEAANTADQVFWANAALVTATNKLGIFGETGGQLKRRTLAALVEGPGQELPQQIISNLATGRPAFEGGGEATLIGSILGGGFGGSVRSPQEDLAKEIESSIETTNVGEGIQRVQNENKSARLANDNAINADIAQPAAEGDFVSQTLQTPQGEVKLTPVSFNPFQNNPLQQNKDEQSVAVDQPDVQAAASKDAPVVDQKEFALDAPQGTAPEALNKDSDTADNEAAVTVLPQEKGGTTPVSKGAEYEFNATSGDKNFNVTVKYRGAASEAYGGEPKEGEPHIVEVRVDGDRTAYISEKLGFNPSLMSVSELGEQLQGWLGDEFTSQDKREAEAKDKLNNQTEEERQANANDLADTFSEIIGKDKATDVAGGVNSESASDSAQDVKFKVPAKATKQLQEVYDIANAATDQKSLLNAADKASEYLKDAEYLSVATQLKKASKQFVAAAKGYPQAENKELDQSVSNENEKIEDLGEKIGGARKDTAVSTGKRAAKEKDDRPAWRKRYVAIENLLAGGGGSSGQFNIFDSRTKKPLRGSGYSAISFNSIEEAEKALPIAAVREKHGVYSDGKDSFSIWRKTAKSRVRVSPETFTTREAGEKYLEENAEDILETKLNFGEEVLPKPEKVYRTGESRRDGNVTGQSFMDKFGFRGVEFGKWNNQQERQEVMNHAYDALLDLADVLDVEPLALSLNGDLALAFGARGQGLSGAKAHYEPARAVINLTKMSGAGSLAHEWFHSLDNYFARLDGQVSSERETDSNGNKVYPRPKGDRGFVSNGFMYNSKARKELQESYKSLITTMMRKATTYVEDTGNAERFVGKARDELRRKLDSIRSDIAEQRDPKYYKRNNKPATTEQLTRFDELADALVNGESLEVEFRANETKRSTSRAIGGRLSNDVLDELATIYKKVRGRNGFRAKGSGPIDRVLSSVNFYRQRIETLKEATESTEKVRKVPTSFYMQAKSADQARSSDYWSSKHEMAARAFEAYVEDKIKAKDGLNNFLTYHSYGAVLVPVYPEGLFKPYPEGKEREAVNEQFENLFNTIQSKKTDKGVALFSKRRLEDLLYSRTKPSQLAGLSVSRVEKIIAPVVLKWNKNAPEIKVVEKLSDVPEHVVDADEHNTNDSVIIEGVYDPSDSTIYLVAENIESPRRALELLAHEAVGHHSFNEMLGEDLEDIFSKVQWLKKKGNDVITDAADRVLEAYGELDEKTEAAEIVANMAERGIKHGLVKRFVSAIKRFLRKLGIAVEFNENELQALIASAERRLESGKPQQKESKKSSRGLFSKRGPPSLDEVESATENAPEASEAVEWLKDKANDWRPAWLAALTRLHLADIAGDILPQINNYVERAQQMDADRNHMIADSADIAKVWSTFQTKNKAEAEAMASLMHDATVAGVDPSESYKAVTTPAETKAEIKRLQNLAKDSPGQAYQFINQIKPAKERLGFENNRAKAYPDLERRYKLLPQEAKDIYKQVRDLYSKRFEITLDSLLERIERSEVSQHEKRKYKDQIRIQFETMKLEAPYFPLARFGDFWVSLKKGEESEFYMFDNSNAANKFARKEQASGVEVTKGKKLENIKPIHGASESFVTEVMDLMGNLKGGMAEQVKDDVWQLYLSTMPDMSVRKHFIHRKKTAGFSEDALRAFSHQTFHGAYQLARLKHSDVMQEQLENMREGLNKSKDPFRATDIFNELEKRHEWAMNPGGSAWVNNLTSLGFVWYLGVTPAAAVVNTSQTALVSLPIMAGKYGYTASGAALIKASKDYFTGGASIDKGMFSVDKILKGDELKAYQEWVDAGVIDKTLAHDLAAMSETPSAVYSAGKAKAMEKVSFLFHHAERFNREVTALATYRLARKAGKSHAIAVQEARDVVWESHFDYSSANKARFMQNDTAKVLLIFRQYSLNMTYLLVRNLQLSLAGESKEVKSIARKKLAGILMQHALTAGAYGLPLFWMVEMIMNAIFDDDDEPWDFRTESRNFLADHFGEKVADSVMKGPIEALTGIGISSRVSLNELWWRSSDRDLEAKAEVGRALEQIAGPIGGIVTGFARGIDLINEGHIQRGIEAMTPKSIKDGLKMLRYNDEGVRNLNGDSVIDDTTVWEEFLRGVGFSPSRVSKRYDENRALRKYANRINDRRKQLINRWWLARRTGDRDGEAEAREQMRTFSRKNPTQRITLDTLKRSAKIRTKNSRESVNGLRLRKSQRRLRDRVRFSDR